jgi:hypothetical protein
MQRVLIPAVMISIRVSARLHNNHTNDVTSKAARSYHGVTTKYSGAFVLVGCVSADSLKRLRRTTGERCGMSDSTL